MNALPAWTRARAAVTQSRRPFQCVFAIMIVGATLVMLDIQRLQQVDRVQVLESRMMSSLLPRDRTLFVNDLWLVAQQSPQLSRGLVIPLFDSIGVLGKSLIVELRALGVDLPIEIPHCDDLSPKYQTILAQDDPLVRIYNVCGEAVKAETSQGGKLFCNDMDHCYERFRTFDIKPLAVVYSRFQEIMLLDADTIHFQSPMNLWETDKYKTTGTLFFHDRVSWDWGFLAELVPGQEGVTKLQQFLASFDIAPFRSLTNIPRPNSSTFSNTTVQAEAATPSPVTLPFEPSDFLLSSHSWNRRAGMEMDSSLVLWNKARQPRATAILASFIALNTTERPPSYGDKEFFFIACELAETAYAFSDFGVGCVGFDLQTFDDEDTGQAEFVLCGEILQFYPVRDISDGDDPSALDGLPQFTNSDNVFTWNPDKMNLYRVKARAAEFYPGSFAKRGIPQHCPFNVSIVALTRHEDARIQERRMSVAALQRAL